MGWAADRRNWGRGEGSDAALILHSACRGLLLPLPPPSRSTLIGAALGYANVWLVRPEPWFRRHTIAAVMFGESSSSSWFRSPPPHHVWLVRPEPWFPETHHRGRHVR